MAIPKLQPFAKLKGRITPQVNFFLRLQTVVEAVRERQEIQRRWWKIDWFKEVYVKTLSVKELCVTGGV